MLWGMAESRLIVVMRAPLKITERAKATAKTETSASFIWRVSAFVTHTQARNNLNEDEVTIAYKEFSNSTDKQTSCAGAWWNRSRKWFSVSLALICPPC